MIKQCTQDTLSWIPNLSTAKSRINLTLSK